MKGVQIRSFFWSVFSRIRPEYGEILCIQFLRFQSECGKYGPEKTSYLDTFHAVYFIVFINHLLCFYISVFRFSFKQPRMCVLNITVWREVFEKFLRTKLFFVKFQTLSLQAFSFQSSLIPNTQTRHFL